MYPEARRDIITSARSIVRKQWLDKFRSDRFWDDCYCSLGKLPKYWLAGLLNSLPGSGFDQGLLNSLDSSDPDSIRMIFSYFTNTRPAQPLPDFMRDKDVCDRILRRRIHDVGDRHVKWATRCLKRQSGKVMVDWAQGGAYKFVFPEDGELATEILYAPIGETVAIPKQVRLEGLPTLFLGRQVALRPWVCGGPLRCWSW